MAKFMKRIRKRIILVKTFYILLDVFFAGLAIYLSALIRSDKLPVQINPHFLLFDYRNPFMTVFVVWILAAVFLNNVYGLYQTRRELLESEEIGQVVNAVFYSSILAVLVIYVLKIEGFPRSIFVMTSCFMVLFFVAWRYAKRQFVQFLVVHGYNNFNVLIIGAGRVGQALAEEIHKHPGFGLKVVGYLDDFKPPEERYHGVPVLGKITDFVRVARREFITKVFITIYHDSQVFINLLEQARRLNILVRVIPQGFELTTGDFFKYNIGFIPILEYSSDDMKIKQVGKRLFDFTLSLIALIVLLPVFVLIALRIKWDSAGPVFYISQRYGYRGKKFGMFKFRSMVREAAGKLPELLPQNEVDGPIFKMKNDPRVTPFGRFLRRYSLDELPQLFNVLVGDMSLVGPRPFPVEQIEKEDLRQLKRLEAKPGITGLWQVRGRSDVPFERLVKWDIWYINNWSFWLDLNILFQTVPVVLHGKGAY